MIFFKFDDLLLLCSDRRVSLTKYKLRAVFSMEEFQVLEGDNLEVEHTFYIRCRNKTVELQAKSSQDKAEWMETLWTVMQNHKARQESFTKVLFFALFDVNGVRKFIHMKFFSLYLPWLRLFRVILEKQ